MLLSFFFFFNTPEFPKQVSHLFMKVHQTPSAPPVQYGKKISLCVLLMDHMED